MQLEAPVNRQVCVLESPTSGIAGIRAEATSRGIRRIDLLESPRAFERVRASAATTPPDTELLDWLRDELTRYFRGELHDFSVPLDLDSAGTSFQRRVWSALREIPYGATRSYGELARALGSPGASRAVGQANGRNPLPIVVPCHRVVSADGGLGGFSAGLGIKRVLLGIEGHDLDHWRPAV